MSYMVKEGPAGFTKAVISLWFRIPGASMDKAAATYVEPEKQKLPGYFTYLVVPDPRIQAYQIEEGIPQYPPRRKPFNGVIPLITFGKPSRRYFIKVDVEYTGNHWIWEWFPGVAFGGPRTPEERASDVEAIYAQFDEHMPFDLEDRGPWEWPHDDGAAIPIPIERLSAQAAPPDGVGSTPIGPEYDPPPGSFKNWQGLNGALGPVGSIGYWEVFASPIVVSHFSPKWEWVNRNETGEKENSEPSYIGVLCKPGKDGATGQLDIKLQTLEHADVKGRGLIKYVLSPDMDYYTGGSEIMATVPEREYVHHVVFTDVLSTKTGPDDDSPGEPNGYEHEYFSAGGAGISEDRWYHLLLSFDIDRPCETGPCPEGAEETGPYDVASAAKFHIAFNDKNLEGESLSKFWANGTGGALNDVLSSTGDEWKKRRQNTPEESEAYIADYPSGSKANHRARDEGVAREDGMDGDPVRPRSSFHAGILQTAGIEIGIPSTAKYVDNIYHCQMAELQMWFGTTLDTNLKKNRRAFITKEGKPVPPNKKRNPKAAVSADPEAENAADAYSGSIELMGRPPDIMLHRSTNWEKGKNTGGTVDELGNIKKGGDFGLVGKVKRYKPDPSLNGPQKPKGENGGGVSG